MKETENEIEIYQEIKEVLKIYPNIFFLYDSLNFICSPNEIIKTKNN